MNPKIGGYFLMASGFVSAAISYLLSQSDFSDLEEISQIIAKCLTVGTLIGSFMLILCGRKFAAIEPGDCADSPASFQYFGSSLLLYMSSCLFGSCGTFTAIMMLGFSEIEDPMPLIEAMPYFRYIVILAVAGLIGMIIIRSTMRDSDVIDAMGWDEDKVYKASSIWRILIALFLPLIILLIILLIALYVSTSVAMDTWTCKCGATNSGGNTCYSCHRTRGGLF